MNRITKPVVRTKDFVVKHRVAIAVVATTIVCAKINNVALKQHNDFLRAEGLYEKFYTPEEV